MAYPADPVELRGMPRIPVENWSDEELQKYLKVGTPLELLREIVLEKYRREKVKYA